MRITTDVYVERCLSLGCSPTMTRTTTTRRGESGGRDDERDFRRAKIARNRRFPHRRETRREPARAPGIFMGSRPATAAVCGDYPAD